MPDRFERFDRFDLPGKTARPVWLISNIPQNATAGIYKGTIEISAKDKHTILNMTIRVQEQLLPKPPDWNTASTFDKIPGLSQTIIR